ncbi:MAG: arsenate reductase family protein [Euryarchaeota archaeon]|nr:arsenate reductase family protein [Euryarchaeota archaeon]
MADLTLYHKPTCSKSREAKRILDESGIPYDVVLYMEDPPSLEDLQAIAKKLDGEPKELMRPKEAIEAGFEMDRGHSDDDVLAFVAKHPAALQRPIVVTPDRAVIGRPTEKVEDLVEETLRS